MALHKATTGTSMAAANENYTSKLPQRAVHDRIVTGEYMSAEFDRYGREYTELLKDPLRDKFAGGAFFHARKWALISEFFRAAGIDTSRLAWLDAGCGKGELLTLGRKHFRRVAGCDPSREMLASASGLDVSLQPDPLSLPFPDGSFDFVTAVCVYHHIDPGSRARFTLEVRRVLARGGIFCVIEHNPINPLTQLIVRRTPIDSNAKLLTRGAAAALCREAGIVPVACKFFLYFPQRIYEAFPREDFLARLPLGGQYAIFGRKQTG